MLVVSLALTGCMQADVGVKINSDGSGSVETVVTVDKQVVIDEMAKMAEEMGEPIDKEQYAKDLDESMATDGYKLVTIDEKEYYQTTEKENIAKGNLQKYFGDENAASYVTTDTVYLEMPNPSESEDMAVMAGEDMPEDAIKFTVTVEMPAAIVSTNGTVDSENKNKASFDLPLDKASTIFVTTKSGVTVKSVKATIKKLKKGKKYYVRVRATKTNYAGIKVYSKWAKKSVKTKK